MWARLLSPTARCSKMWAWRLTMWARLLSPTTWCLKMRAWYLMIGVPWCHPLDHRSSLVILVAVIRLRHHAQRQWQVVGSRWYVVLFHLASEALLRVVQWALRKGPPATSRIYSPFCFFDPPANFPLLSSSSSDRFAIPATTFSLFRFETSPIQDTFLSDSRLPRQEKLTVMRRLNLTLVTMHSTSGLWSQRMGLT